MKQLRLLLLLCPVLPGALGLINADTDLQTVALDIPVPQATEDPAPVAELAKTRFTKSVWGGSGCPIRKSPSDPRTLEFAVGRDGTLGYDFTNLYAYVGPAWEDQAEGEQQQKTGATSTTECMTLVSIGNIDPGWSFRVTGGKARGYYSRTAGSSLQIGVTLDFSGDGDGIPSPTVQGYTGFGLEPASGPFEKEFLTIDDGNRRSAETPCVPGKASFAMLNLTMSVTATSESSPAEWGILQIKGVELEGYLWPCDV
ncbi:uncharacterized protein DNG_04876 [Cephalotrichum gorgonifer]|uniref:Secreted protein n=1 Tax=Cephalotrichum gorgonifer TaxID=2041049 RepID=A0AAE8SUZ9_9PEZI|nr:uncharacterized protein DNG_04876 [Cephalotrichum gorgonifer]